MSDVGGDGVGALLDAEAMDVKICINLILKDALEQVICVNRTAHDITIYFTLRTTDVEIEGALAAKGTKSVAKIP